MAKRQPFTFESNREKIVLKIQDVPGKVLNVVGRNLVKEIKSTTMKSQFHQRRGILNKTLGYWARKKDKDLQIGFKMSIPGIVGNMITGQEADPIKPVVVKNAQIIQDMIRIAIDEIGRK